MSIYNYMCELKKNFKSKFWYNVQSTGNCPLFQLFRLFILLSVSLLSACSVPEDAPEQRIDLSVGGALSADILTSYDVGIVSSVNNGVKVWELSTGQLKFDWRHEGDANNLVTKIDISADGLYAMTADREAFALWDLTVGEPVGFWRIDIASIRDIAVSKKGETLLVGRGDGSVLLLNPKTGRRLEFMGHTEKINAVDLSPNGFYALTGSNDYTALLWDTRTAQVLRKFEHQSRVSMVGLDEYGRYAFTADSKDHSKIWDITTGQLISTLQYFERQKIITALKFSKDGKYLLTGSPSRALDLWDVQTGERLARYKVGVHPDASMPTAMVHSVDFMPDSEIPASLSSSGFFEIWHKAIRH